MYTMRISTFILKKVKMNYSKGFYLSNLYWFCGKSFKVDIYIYILVTDSNGTGLLFHTKDKVCQLVMEF